MLPQYVSRTKRTHKPSRIAARRLRDVEFDDKENSACLLRPIQPFAHGHHDPHSPPFFAQAKRTKRVMSASSAARKLDFNACELYANEENVHGCKISRLSLMDDVSTARCSFLDHLKSYYQVEGEGGCDFDVELADGVRKYCDDADGLFRFVGDGGAGCHGKRARTAEGPSPKKTVPCRRGLSGVSFMPAFSQHPTDLHQQVAWTDKPGGTLAQQMNGLTLANGNDLDHHNGP